MKNRKLLILDNYDSFTYNLVHLIEEISDIQFDVFRNDKISIEQVAAYDKILLSPGPGLPANAGIMPELLRTYASSKSIFGVCLGLQAMGEAFGGKLKNLSQVYHGIARPVKVVSEDLIFSNCPKEFNVGRYHSWVVDSVGLPNEIQITAIDSENNIMAFKHKTYDVRGVQFHPESVLSEYGKEIMEGWLSIG